MLCREMSVAEPLYRLYPVLLEITHNVASSNNRLIETAGMLQAF